MGERQIHPAVLVEIEGDDADGRGQIFFLEIDRRERMNFPSRGFR